MNILHTAIYHIDHQKDDVEAGDAVPSNEDLKSYLQDLLERIGRVDSKRLFKFATEQGEVRACIKALFDQSTFPTATLTIARRLLYKEQIAQQDNANLKNDIPRGKLIVILFEEEGLNRLVISKADNARYLNERDLKLEQGLPYEKKTYKALLADFNGDHEIEKVSIYDTNARIAKYWFSDFLELEEINTNVYNTNTAFDAIEKNVLNRIRNEFPADYNILRNRVIGYFRSKESFELQDFIDSTVGEDYDPVNPEFKPKVREIIAKMRALPDLKAFDSQFTIAKEEIRARKINNVVKLNDKMDLHIKDFVGDLNQIVKAVEENGLKYIRIRTDEGFKAFKENKADETAG